jgi:hypothetical protein
LGAVSDAPQTQERGGNAPAARRFRFGLKSLLALTTIVALAAVKTIDYLPFSLRRDAILLVVSEAEYDRVIEEHPIVPTSASPFGRGWMHDYPTNYTLRVSPRFAVDALLAIDQPNVIKLDEQQAVIHWPNDGSFNLSYKWSNLPPPKEGVFESLVAIIGSGKVEPLADKRLLQGQVSGFLGAERSWGRKRIRAALVIHQVFATSKGSPAEAEAHVLKGRLLYHGPVVDEDLVWASPEVAGRRYLIVLRNPRRP